MKTKNPTRNTSPAKPNSSENRNSPVVSGETPINIGIPRTQEQENNTKDQAQEQANPPVNGGSKHPANRSHFQPGQSGNPKGRPVNSPNKASQAARAMLEMSAPELLAKAISLALDGNATALKLCFERILPQRGPVHLARLAKLSTKTNGAESVLASHNAVLEAVASGEITPQDGQSVSAIVDARRRSWESLVTEEQIADLQDCSDDARSHRTPKKPSGKTTRNSKAQRITARKTSRTTMPKKRRKTSTETNHEIPHHSPPPQAAPAPTPTR